MDFMPKIDDYLTRLKCAMDNLDRAEVNNFINILLEARKNGKTIYVMGNGGSASTAAHFKCDIEKGTVTAQSKEKFKIVSLCDNLPTIMAYANDVSYEDIFVEQLRNHLNKNDVVIAFSGSGNSKNVIKAIEYANQCGAVTCGVTGYDGGELKKTAKYSVNANVSDMQISEDVHMMLLHLTMQALISG